MNLYDEGKVIHYRLDDNGDSNLLHYCQAPRTLSLKIGSPVINVQIIDDVLVNGLKG